MKRKNESPRLSVEHRILTAVALILTIITCARITAHEALSLAADVAKAIEKYDEGDAHE